MKTLLIMILGVQTLLCSAPEQSQQGTGVISLTPAQMDVMNAPDAVVSYLVTDEQGSSRIVETTDHQGMPELTNGIVSVTLLSRTHNNTTVTFIPQEQAEAMHLNLLRQSESS